jgi:uncharacterized phage-associated protein
MNHMKLIKLLYLADRAALLRWGRPITFDSYVSMPHGPVLSFTLDKINDAALPDGSSYWHSIISERQGHEVALLGAAPNDRLSAAEESLLDEIYQRYGGMTQWELRDFSHTLPEWQDPNGSSLPIELRDILLSEGMSEADAEGLLEALQAESLADRLLSA